ncbi:MAG TPA: hypothetical protein PKY82_20395 [Pyrinomonadaceae bacterium]|nr:hypothetical protein [Pyrinomonadaceae bacterium]
MTVQVAGNREVPAGLPMVEESESREKLFREAANNDQAADDNLTVESEDETPEEFVTEGKTPKKKIFFAFVLVVAAFLLLILMMSWFFGIGAFAAAKPQAVDRTAKTKSENTAPVSEEDKLKMALNLVAEKNSNAKTDEASNSTSTNAANSSVDVPRGEATDLNEPVIVRDPLSETIGDKADSEASRTKIEDQKITVSSLPNRLQASVPAGRNKVEVIEPQQESNNAPRGRSLFFGIEDKKITQIKQVAVPNIQPISPVEKVNLSLQPKYSIPFGTLLPVRLLGAVYTLRNSGSMVRMELTRQITGKNYSYPAGTILVGTLRGSEYKRAFISVVGLIDPNTGGLVKFTGEVMGNDGASGLEGRKRQIKSSWSRLLGALSDIGTVAVGALGNRRSGGTVIISDSTNKASGVLSDELSGVFGNNQKTNEFVEVSAATGGFVLVTDLPGEVSKTNSPAQNSKSATGLSDDELADILSFGNKEKIRVALPGMTPEFRLLAEKYLETAEK